MYKLDLDTITEERLRKAVSAETYALGEELLDRLPVQVVETTETSASLVIQDKRRYFVDIRISHEHVLLKCNCAHGQRALICEHEVAGWLALNRHLVRRQPAPWQSQLNRVIDSTAMLYRPAKTAAYYLFFSLQQETRSITTYWHIVPYQLPFSTLPVEIRRSETPPSEAEIIALMASTPGLERNLKKPASNLDPQGCVNANLEAVNLANILSERSRIPSYALETSFRLENYLALIERAGSSLYLGRASQPLGQRLQLHPQPAELRLQISRDENGLRLTTVLVPVVHPPRWTGGVAVPPTPTDMAGALDQFIEDEGADEPASLDPSLPLENSPVDAGSLESLVPPADGNGGAEMLDTTATLVAADIPVNSIDSVITPVIDQPPLAVDLQDISVLLVNPHWLLAGDHVIALTNPAGLSLLDFFSQQKELLIPNEQADSFVEQYLLDLARRFPLQGSAITWEQVQTDPRPRLYLSDRDGELHIQLHFAYGGHEVRYDPDYPAITILRRLEGLKLVQVVRATAVERRIYETLSSPSFGLKRAALPGHAGLFRLRARVHPVDFLLNMAPRLAQSGFEIYGEEQLKTARVNRNTPTISFRISTGIDWFDVHTVVNFGDLEVGVVDIRRALRKRERYIKLADGSIGEIPEAWIERYKHLFILGEMQEDGLRLSRHHFGLVEQALNDADRGSADEAFIQQRSRLRALLEQKTNGGSEAWIADRPLPDGFLGDLRHYQKAGYDWLHFLHEFKFGGCLADDMGLGKTIQALAFLHSLYNGAPEARPESASLLVVPRSLLTNWQREAERFAPSLRILEFFAADRMKDTDAFKEYHLVITTYGVLLRDIQMLHGYTFHYAILDESQAIKNPGSQTARAAHLLRAAHHLVLTGTPIENSTAELWSQFAFLNPGLLGSLQYFRTEFGLPIEKKADPKAAENLRKLVYPFILRRTKDQVAPELPPRTEKILYCEMEPAQRKLYNRTRDYFRGVVLGLLDREGMNAGRMKILEGLLRLRQICNHPLLVDEKFHGGSAKFELLLDTLETLHAENHKALVFSQFVQMLSVLRGEMDSRQLAYTYLDGQTIARQEQVDRFQADPTIPFFLISLRAGGLGLNLTAADYVIHIDPWWNPAVEMQASDRTHRIGQDKPVFIFKLIARDSVEEKILILQERKRSLVDQIITTENGFFKSLTRADIEELFTA